jgi:RHH-type transcriptional regulator, rel operon repressor / antitoxin RelB
MSTTTTVSLRLDPAKAKRLAELAQSTDRPKSWHLEQALENYLEMHQWQIEHIRASIKQADAGMLGDHEEVFARVRKRIARSRKKQA